MGLIRNPEHFNAAIRDAAFFKMPRGLQTVFATLFTFYVSQCASSLGHLEGEDVGNLRQSRKDGCRRRSPYFVILEMCLPMNIRLMSLITTISEDKIAKDKESRIEVPDDLFSLGDMIREIFEGVYDDPGHLSSRAIHTLKNVIVNKTNLHILDLIGHASNIIYGTDYFSGSFGILFADASRLKSYRELKFGPNSTYNKQDSPYDITHKPMTIYMEIPYIVLISLEENKQQASYIVNVNMTWLDPRLAYNSAVLGLNYTIIPSNLIWIPLVNCWNCIDLHNFDKEAESNEVLVQPDGMVTLYNKARYDTICKFEISAFPFDVQFCGVNFDLGLSFSDRAILSGQQTYADYTGTQEWEIEPYSVMSNATQWSQYIVMIKYKLTRRADFYLYFMILPTLVITGSCLSALLLPSGMSNSEKINMGVTGLLGLTFLLSIIVQEVPRSKNLPIIGKGVWYSFVGKFNMGVFAKHFNYSMVRNIPGKWLLIEMFFCILAMALVAPMKRLRRRWEKRHSNADEVVDGLCFLTISGTNAAVTLYLLLYPGAQESPSSEFLM